MIYWQDMVKFIRMVSRVSLDSTQERFIRQFIHQDVPWDQMLLMAESEGVVSLMYHHLSRLATTDRVPESVWIRLKTVYQEHQQRQEAIMVEAKRISRGLSENGLSAIALQGLSLYHIYRLPGLRPAGDMDILIKEEDHSAIAALLEEKGFCIPNPVYPNNFFKDGIWLDLHTHILNLDRIQNRRYIFPMDLSALWNRAVPLFQSFNGLLRPDPIDNVILLSAHIIKHGYSRIIWIADLNESLENLITAPNGWNDIIERAVQWQQEKILLYGLTILEGILKRHIPLEIKNRLGYPRLSGFEKYLLRLRINGRIFSGYHVALWFLLKNRFFSQRR